MSDKEIRLTTSFRCPRDLWAFIRKEAFDEEISINEIIVRELTSWAKKNGFNKNKKEC